MLKKTHADRSSGLTNSERKQLIDWVNSIEIPECKQANSSLSFK